MRKWFNQKISRQIMSAFYLILITLSVSSIAAYFYTNHQVMDAKKSLDAISERQERATTLWDNWQSLQYEMRGYIVFGDDAVLDLVEEKTAALEKETKWFEQNGTYRADQLYASDVRALYTSYTTFVMPSLIKYVKAKQDGTVDEAFLQMPSLTSMMPQVKRDPNRKFKMNASDSETMRQNVNTMESVFTNYRTDLQAKEMMAKDKLVKQTKYAEWIWLINLLVLFFVILLIIRPFIERTTRQIQLLSKESKLLAQGQHTAPLIPISRADEIGELSKSFHQMATALTDNKHRLMSSNDNLEQALQLTLRNEAHLKIRNQLTETLASRDTVTAYPAVIEKMVEITDSTNGSLIFKEGTTVTNIISHAMTEQEQDELISTIEPVIRKARKDRVPHTAQFAERSFAVTPVLDASTDEIIAYIYLMRLHRPFDRQEQEELAAFARQLALSLLRMRTFDEIGREREKSARLLNSIRESILYIEPDGPMQLINRPLLDLFNHPSATDSKADWLIEVDDSITSLKYQVDQLPEFERYLRQTFVHRETGEGITFSIDHETRFIKTYSEEIHYGGKFRGILLVLRDVTNEVEVDRIKNELVSTISHELRTPLSSIYGFTELMIQRDLPANRQKKYLAAVHSETERLSLLINDFLDLQRMEANHQEYTFEPFDLIPMIKDLKQLHSLSSSAHDIQILSDVPVQIIQGDSKKIRQLFGNLINNAIKYSPAGGPIEIRLEEHHDRMTVAITDHGIGIPASAMSELFQKFYRVDNSDTRKIGGTGLGLSICREIARAHDGEIHVESIEGQGSTFTVELPLNPPPPL
ncbi:ATP-binding protein [Exiguobacterium antarcticum]|uniref:histidine kinase n=2 Tax=Exiguobacterium antarcticum TaxID=132920 RepID=A0ABT6R0P4_9BACL|nr:ATP-binding protein [Exiguobacterium antarcticum]